MMGKTRIEELCYELYGSWNQHDSWQRYAMIRELRELMKQPKGGSDHFERFGDDRRIDGDDRRFGVGQFRDGADDDEEQYLVMDEELAEMEDRAVENETNTKMISAIDKDESMPQSKVPVSDSENFRSKELGKSDLELEKLDHVVMNENLELEWDQVSVNGKLEVVGEVERDQKLISDANTCCAHKVFVKIPRKEKRIKHLKGWKFKFKPTSKTSRSMDVKHFYVEEIALLNKDPKETIWNGVKKEFKETMAACGMKRVDRFKLVDEKESRLEVLNLKPTCLYHQIGHGEKERLGIQKKKKGFKSWMFKYKKGNKKRDLLLLNGGGIVVTTDGNDILREIDAAHPAAKSMIELSRTQDEEVGVGTTSVNVPAGELLHVGESFIEKSYHPTVIFQAYNKALEGAIVVLHKIAMPIDVKDRATALGLVKSCIGTKFISKFGNLIADLAIDATTTISVDLGQGLREVDISDLAVEEYMMGKADEMLLPGHYGLLHTFDQCGGLNATVIAGTIMQSSLKLFHQLRVACLHHTSLGFIYGSLPRPPEANHSNFSNMLQYHETWSCISLRTNRVWDPGGSNSETDCLKLMKRILLPTRWIPSLSNLEVKGSSMEGDLIQERRMRLVAREARENETSC